jgi:hypothetical protein
MTKQETLPVWAKILLGIPAKDAVPVNPSELRTTANPSQKDSVPSDADATEQSVLVFDPISQGRTWGLRRILQPVRREFQA